MFAFKLFFESYQCSFLLEATNVIFFLEATNVIAAFWLEAGNRQDSYLWLGDLIPQKLCRSEGSGGENCERETVHSDNF